MKKYSLLLGIQLLLIQLCLGQTPSSKYIQVSPDKTKDFIGTWRYTFGKDTLTVTFKRNKVYVQGSDVYVDAVEGTGSVRTSNSEIPVVISMGVPTIKEDPSALEAHLMGGGYFVGGRLTLSLQNRNTLRWYLNRSERLKLIIEGKKNQANNIEKGAMPDKLILKRIK